MVLSPIHVETEIIKQTFINNGNEERKIEENKMRMRGEKRA